jgi:hypothetical protein
MDNPVCIFLLLGMGGITYCNIIHLQNEYALHVLYMHLNLAI